MKPNLVLKSVCFQTLTNSNLIVHYKVRWKLSLVMLNTNDQSSTLGNLGAISSATQS